MQDDVFYSILAAVGVISFVLLFVKYGSGGTYTPSQNDDLNKLRQIEEYNRIEKLTREIDNRK